MKYTIEIPTDDVNRIIVNDLKYVFRWKLDDEEDDCELLNAIEVVLAYYMESNEYKEWFKTRGRE
jgi:hypothetical protein